MLRYLLLTSTLFIAIATFSQDISYITFTGGSTFSSFSFKTDQGAIIKISDDGKVMEWGTEMETQRLNYYPGKLQPYMGRVDYYGPEADSISQGKVKSIGTCFLTYYGPYETPTRQGKLKSLGHVLFDYYTNYENEAFRGKIQTAGSAVLSYYSSYDNEAFRGKLKSVASTPIVYYSSFDDKAIQGKIKSLGQLNYVWYVSNDQYRGGLKSGSPRPVINGITYLIQ